ncbi:MAG: hypothetical protein P8N76_18535 [Pirellulaceae bacterium]|nr:hypothetical protein [Pirellulaceae bacterium]
MAENPFQSPDSPSPAVGVISGSHDDLRKVAKFQKGVLVCILIQLVVVFICLIVLPSELVIIALGISSIVGIVSAVFVFLLSVQVYGVALGIVFGVGCLLPCIGLISLLVVNGKATAVLKQNGIKVGLLGADLSSF